ncbi:LOW QUALITY PROTEIN: hypothetical protein PHMEG_0001965 [Phytophthora megakarya]|uniref:Uncharacterized protein n=1 Tax=Phytophthora megakarya TaxID=4795 RepID=A0A225X0I1_9STRA|nr:LOW QUALITY PROTEIN: hypothetical protein PHMEG_0001965 [Phytophthora megakarya]
MLAGGFGTIVGWYTQLQISIGGNHITTCWSEQDEEAPAYYQAWIPMSLAMLSQIIVFLESNAMFNNTMSLWFSAVCLLSIYGTCRINEQLLMKRCDTQLGFKYFGRLVARSGLVALRFAIEKQTTTHLLAKPTRSIMFPKKKVPPMLLITWTGNLPMLIQNYIIGGTITTTHSLR